MIEVQHLTKAYGNQIAVEDLSFTIPRGQIYGLLGPNGAGKSTTMNILAGCLAATEGEVHIDGYDIFEDAAKAKSRIGYLPEQPPLYLDCTPREYLTFVARAKKVPEREISIHILDIMEKTGVEDVADRLMKNLSKGYKQRVGLACAMLGDPPVIILDDSDSEYWTVYAPTLSKTGYVNRNYLVYNFRASSDQGKTLDFPYSSNAQLSETSNNRIRMRVQVINRSNTKTVSSFTLLYYAEDEDGVFVTDDYWLQESIDYKRVDPGEIVYTDYLSFPQADKIKKAYVEIKEVGFTDGTTIEYNGDERPFATWTLK